MPIRLYIIYTILRPWIDPLGQEPELRIVNVNTTPTIFTSRLQNVASSQQTPILQRQAERRGLLRPCGLQWKPKGTAIPEYVNTWLNKVSDLAKRSLEREEARKEHLCV